MQVSPKFQSVALGVLAGLGVIAALTPSMFPSFVPPGEAADIAKSAGLLDTLVAGVGSAMGLWASSQPGPLAPPDPPPVVHAQAEWDAAQARATADHAKAVADAHAAAPPAA